MIERKLSPDRKKALFAAGIYYAILLGAWAVLEIFVMTMLSGRLSDDVLEIIKEFFLKIPIWFLPAFILCRHFDGSMYAGKGDIFSFKKKHLPFLVIIPLFVVYHAVLSFRAKGGIIIDSGFSVLDVLIAVSVGICEEMVFRGLFLNVTLREGKNNFAAVAVNSLLFLIIHFPVWYRTGTLAVNLQSGAFLALILLSIIFSYVFVKTKSLLIPAALHICWDLLCFMQ